MTAADLFGDLDARLAEIVLELSRRGYGVRRTSAGLWIVALASLSVTVDDRGLQRLAERAAGIGATG